MEMKGKLGRRGLMLRQGCWWFFYFESSHGDAERRACKDGPFRFVVGQESCPREPQDLCLSEACGSRWSPGVWGSVRPALLGSTLSRARSRSAPA